MRSNLIRLFGFELSLCGILFLFTTQFLLSGFSSSLLDSPMRGVVRSAVTILALICFAGTAISLISLFGAVLQLPCLIVLLPLTWYLGSIYWIYYVLSLAGCIILILSMFVRLEHPGRKPSIPPRSRRSWWHVRDDGTTSRHFSEFARRAIAIAIVGSVIALASFTFYVSSNEVSRLKVSVWVNGLDYGSVDFTVYLDGDAMYTGAMTYDSPNFVMQEFVYLDLSSGSHTVVLDAWNGSEDLSIGDVDSVAHVRTLPFTEDVAHLVLGIGFS